MRAFFLCFNGVYMRKTNTIVQSQTHRLVLFFVVALAICLCIGAVFGSAEQARDKPVERLTAESARDSPLRQDGFQPVLANDAYAAMVAKACDSKDEDLLPGQLRYAQAFGALTEERDVRSIHSIGVAADHRFMAARNAITGNAWGKGRGQSFCKIAAAEAAILLKEAPANAKEPPALSAHGVDMFTHDQSITLTDMTHWLLAKGLITADDIGTVHMRVDGEDDGDTLHDLPACAATAAHSSIQNPHVANGDKAMRMHYYPTNIANLALNHPLAAGTAGAALPNDDSSSYASRLCTINDASASKTVSCLSEDKIDRQGVHTHQLLALDAVTAASTYAFFDNRRRQIRDAGSADDDWKWMVACGVATAYWVGRLTLFSHRSASSQQPTFPQSHTMENMVLGGGLLDVSHPSNASLPFWDDKGAVQKTALPQSPRSAEPPHAQASRPTYRGGGRWAYLRQNDAVADAGPSRVKNGTTDGWYASAALRLPHMYKMSFDNAGTQTIWRRAAVKEYAKTSKGKEVGKPTVLYGVSPVLCKKMCDALDAHPLPEHPERSVVLSMTKRALLPRDSGSANEWLFSKATQRTVSATFTSKAVSKSSLFNRCLGYKVASTADSSKSSQRPVASPNFACTLYMLHADTKNAAAESENVAKIDKLATESDKEAGESRQSPPKSSLDTLMASESLHAASDGPPDVLADSSFGRIDIARDILNTHRQGSSVLPSVELRTGDVDYPPAFQGRNARSAQKEYAKQDARHVLEHDVTRRDKQRRYTSDGGFWGNDDTESLQNDKIELSKAHDGVLWVKQQRTSKVLPGNDAYAAAWEYFRLWSHIRQRLGIKDDKIDLIGLVKLLSVESPSDRNTCGDLYTSDKTEGKKRHNDFKVVGDFASADASHVCKKGGDCVLDESSAWWGVSTDAMQQTYDNAKAAGVMAPDVAQLQRHMQSTTRHSTQSGCYTPKSWYFVAENAQCPTTATRVLTKDECLIASRYIAYGRYKKQFAENIRRTHKDRPNSVNWKQYFKDVGMYTHDHRHPAGCRLVHRETIGTAGEFDYDAVNFSDGSLMNPDLRSSPICRWKDTAMCTRVDLSRCYSPAHAFGQLAPLLHHAYAHPTDHNTIESKQLTPLLESSTCARQRCNPGNCFKRLEKAKTEPVRVLPDHRSFTCTFASSGAGFKRYGFVSRVNETFHNTASMSCLRASRTHLAHMLTEDAVVGASFAPDAKSCAEKCLAYDVQPDKGRALLWPEEGQLLRNWLNFDLVPPNGLPVFANANRDGFATGDWQGLVAREVGGGKRDARDISSLLGWGLPAYEHLGENYPAKVLATKRVVIPDYTKPINDSAPRLHYLHSWNACGLDRGAFREEDTQSPYTELPKGHVMAESVKEWGCDKLKARPLNETIRIGQRAFVVEKPLFEDAYDYRVRLDNGKYSERTGYKGKELVHQSRMATFLMPGTSQAFVETQSDDGLWHAAKVLHIRHQPYPGRAGYGAKNQTPSDDVLDSGTTYDLEVLSKGRCLAVPDPSNNKEAKCTRAIKGQLRLYADRAGYNESYTRARYLATGVAPGNVRGYDISKGLTGPHNPSGYDDASLHMYSSVTNADECRRAVEQFVSSKCKPEEERFTSQFVPHVGVPYEGLILEAVPQSKVRASRPAAGGQAPSSSADQAKPDLSHFVNPNFYTPALVLQRHRQEAKRRYDRVSLCKFKLPAKTEAAMKRAYQTGGAGTASSQASQTPLKLHYLHSFNACGLQRSAFTTRSAPVPKHVIAEPVKEWGCDELKRVPINETVSIGPNVYVVEQPPLKLHYLHSFNACGLQNRAFKSKRGPYASVPPGHVVAEPVKEWGCDKLKQFSTNEIVGIGPHVYVVEQPNAGRPMALGTSGVWYAGKLDHAACKGACTSAHFNCEAYVSYKASDASTPHACFLHDARAGATATSKTFNEGSTCRLVARRVRDSCASSDFFHRDPGDTANANAINCYLYSKKAPPVVRSLTGQEYGENDNTVVHALLPAAYLKWARESIDSLWARGPVTLPKNGQQVTASFSEHYMRHGLEAKHQAHLSTTLRAFVQSTFSAFVQQPLFRHMSNTLATYSDGHKLHIDYTQPEHIKSLCEHAVARLQGSATGKCGTVDEQPFIGHAMMGVKHTKTFDNGGQFAETKLNPLMHAPRAPYSLHEDAARGLVAQQNNNLYAYSTGEHWEMVKSTQNSDPTFACFRPRGRAQPAHTMITAPSDRMFWGRMLGWNSASAETGISYADSMIVALHSIMHGSKTAKSLRATDSVQEHWKQQYWNQVKRAYNMYNAAPDTQLRPDLAVDGFRTHARLSTWRRMQCSVAYVPNHEVKPIKSKTAAANTRMPYGNNFSNADGKQPLGGMSVHILGDENLYQGQQGGCVQYTNSAACNLRPQCAWQEHECQPLPVGEDGELDTKDGAFKTKQTSLLEDDRRQRRETVTGLWTTAESRRARARSKDTPPLPWETDKWSYLDNLWTEYGVSHEGHYLGPGTNISPRSAGFVSPRPTRPFDSFDPSDKPEVLGLRSTA